MLALAGVARPGAGANRLHPLLRQEPDPLRQLRLAYLPDRTFRDLLLPGDRAAPRAHRRLRRERVSARQLRAETRSLDEAAADPVLDGERVLAAERDSRRGAGRRRRVRRAGPLSHRHADRRAARSALPTDRPRADAPVPVRHHPDRPDPPQHAAVGVRGHVGLHDRLLAPARHHDRARRRGLGHRAEDERDGRVRRLQQSRA